MMVKSSTMAQQRASICSAAPRLPCLSAPLLRRVAVIRRFKEDDKVEQVKESVQQDTKGMLDSLNGPSPMNSGVKVPFFMPAFTRRREVFVGRIAQMGFLACCVLEILTPEHFGPVQQLRLTTGLANAQIVSLISSIVLYNILGAVGPWSPTYSPENLRDVAKRPEGPPNVMVSPLNVKKFLGISGWGFTKRNELFVGRLAMLGFWAAFNNELATGKGPLGQVATALNIVPNDDFFSTCAKGGLAFFALMIVLSFVGPSHLQGNLNAEDEIY